MNKGYGVAVLIAAWLWGVGCTQRPLATGEPTGIRPVVLRSGEEQKQVVGIDLLLVVDDSISMADKQNALRRSFERLLVTPASCVAPQKDPDKDPDIRVPAVDGQCPEGWGFEPVLPVARSSAVITTSLRAGGEACVDSDRGAHPIQPSNDGTINSGRSYIDALQEVGEEGCGFEAPLEAMYRFLIDPDPPLRVTTTEIDGNKVTAAQGVDEELLLRRAEFLGAMTRVLIVILSDEDDCSVIDSGPGFEVSVAPGLGRGSSTCDEDPNDVCCRSCTEEEQDTPEGCGPLAEDPVCSTAARHSPDEDPVNLRCWDQKRRFGKDLLFPIQRYVDGLTNPTILDRAGNEVENPLFVYGRTPDMVSVLVLSGNPWQALVTPESVDQSDLMEFRTFEELQQAQVFDQIVGDVERGVAPTDPHLVSSPRPRAGLPLAGDEWDTWTGHEIVRPVADELQISCLFDLPESRPCEDDECICWDQSFESPLCLDDNGDYGTTQVRAQAYPSPRLTQFAKRLGPRGFLGSICPRTLEDRVEVFAQPGFGYSDAFLMMAYETYNSDFPAPVCYRDSLPRDYQQNSACRVLEMHEQRVDCSALGRAEAPARFREALLTYTNRQADAARVSVCEIRPFSGAVDDPESDYHKCAYDLHPDIETEGYCIIDPSEGQGSSELVSMCAPGHKRRVRMIPLSLPLPETTSVLVCDYG